MVLSKVDRGSLMNVMIKLMVGNTVGFPSESTPHGFPADAKLNLIPGM